MELRLPILTNQVRQALLLRKTGRMPITKMASIQKQSRFKLYAGDQKVGKAVELSADNKWTHTFSNLDEKKAGQVINYTVKEIDVPEGYTQAVEATNPGQVVVTNTHEPEKTKVEVSKKWEDGDDQDGLRPASIQVQLYKDGLPTDQVLELSAANDWKGAFENLDAKAAGKAIAIYSQRSNCPRWLQSNGK